MKFRSYEVHPCKVVDTILHEDGKREEVMEQCEEDDTEIACWSLYENIGTMSDDPMIGGLECLLDFDTKAEAESLMERIGKLPVNYRVLRMDEFLQVGDFVYSWGNHVTTVKYLAGSPVSKCVTQSPHNLVGRFAVRDESDAIQ